MKYQSIARVMFPLAGLLCTIALARFCISSYRAHQWTVLIMGSFSTLSVLALFIGLWITVKKKMPITEHEVLVAMSVFLVVASLVLNFVTR